MLKVILDTNVLVSALIQKNFPYLILHECLAGERIQMCVSHDIYFEYAQVLRREKFLKIPDFGENAEALLVDIRKYSVFYKPKEELDILQDKSDNKFLELAKESNADYLITGNTKDFTLNEFGNTEILVPADFWSSYNNHT